MPERVGLAVSGGPDSMAMALLAHAVLDDFEVATVNHGLRPQAAEECRLVEELCDRLEIPCTVIDIVLAKGNLQQEARKARYAALGDWATRRGLGAILTAHQADDQAETLLMRLNRGSGLPGLAGIRSVGTVEGCDVPVMRPLLRFSRSELKRLVDDAGVRVADDPSNRDDRFERVRVRKAIAGSDWLDAAGVAHSAALLGEAGDALDHYAAREFLARAEVAPGQARYHPEGPGFVRKRVVQMIFAELGKTVDLGAVSDLIETAVRQGSGNLSGLLMRIEDGQWMFEPEPPRQAG